MAEATNGSMPPIINALGTVRTLAITAAAVVTGDADGNVRWWNKTTGDELCQQEQDGAVSALVALPNGQIVSGSENGSITRWSAAADHRPTVVCRSGPPVTCLAVTAKHQLVSGHPNSMIVVRPAGLGKLITLDNTEPVTALVVIGQQIVTGAPSGTLRRWSVTTNRGVLTEKASTDDREVIALAAAADLVAVSRHGPVEIEIVDLHLAPLNHLPGGVSALAMLPDDGQLVGGGAGGVAVWSAPPTGAGQPLPGGHGQATAVAVARHGGERWIAAANHNEVRVWQNSTELHRPFKTRHQGQVSDIVIRPTGDIVSGGEDGTVQFWRADGVRRDEIDLRRPVTALAANGGQVVIASGTATSPITVRVFTDPERVVVDLKQNQDGVYALAIAAGTHTPMLISGGNDGTLQLWNLNQHTRIGEPLPAHQPARVFCLAASGTGQLVSGGGRSVKLWNLAQRSEIRELHQAAAVRSVAISPDGDTVASGGADGIVRVWRLADLASPAHELPTADSEVRAVAIITSPTTGQPSVLAAGPRGIVQEWDLRTGDPVEGEWPSSFTGGISVLRPDPRGGRVVAGGTAGEIQVLPFTTPVIPVEPDDQDEQPHGARVPDPEVLSDEAGVIDRIGITQDVTAMAALIAAHTTTAPLSIAVLGEWGAGKSTFLNLVSKRIADLAEMSQQVDEKTAYVKQIRQIRFNAWHYSDEHVWTGLIEHLFTELAGPPTPDAGGPTKAETRQALAALDKKLAEVRAKLDLAKGHRWDGVGSEILKGSEIVLRTARAAARRHKMFPLWLAAGCAVAGAIIGGAIMLGHLFPVLPAILSVVGAIVAAVVGSLHNVYQKVKNADAEVKEATDAYLERLTNEKQEIETQLDAHRALLNGMPSDDDPVRTFVRQISAPERFARYRGLVGELHRDLRQLADMLARSQQGASTENSGGAYDRIVLYIDDLDRCLPGRVIEVLHAINLLLSLPLFVVVVAVDTPWLMRSLEQRYDGLLTGDDSSATAPSTKHALHFLDKIFHIPFALEPLSDKASGYLASLLPPTRQPPPAPPRPRIPTPGLPVEPPTGPTEPAAEPTTAIQTTPVGKHDVVRAGLEITPAEAAFLPRLACLLRGPRELKKLANLYRLVRVGQHHDLEAFVAGPYRAAALLLAAMINAPDEFATLARLLACANPDRNIVESLRARRNVSGHPAPPIAERLAEVITTIQDDNIGVHDTTSTYQAWATQVARYGFATYPVFVHRNDRLTPDRHQEHQPGPTP